MSTSRNANDLVHLKKHMFVVLAALILNDAKTATKFVDRRTVVRAHRITYARKTDDPKCGLDLRVKIGRPNYHESKFIKACLRAKEPFPVKRVRLAFVRA